MRLTMCARGDCGICKYQESHAEECYERTTKNMNILADALEIADTPQKERSE